MFLRNAPTKLMKEHGYGDGYQYDHATPDHYAGQACLPDALLGQEFYQPGSFGFEKDIAKRMEWWDARRQHEHERFIDMSDIEQHDQPVWLAGIGAFGDVGVLSALILGGKPDGLGDSLRQGFAGCQDQRKPGMNVVGLCRSDYVAVGMINAGVAVAVVDASVENARPVPVPLVGWT